MLARPASMAAPNAAQLSKCPRLWQRLPAPVLGTFSAAPAADWRNSIMARSLYVAADSSPQSTGGGPAAAPVTLETLQQRKASNTPITMMTAYDSIVARVANELVDTVLVGDSLGQVVNGYASTVPVTLDEVLYHSKAVVRAAPLPLVVGDLPFGSYTTVDDALRSSVRLVKEGGVAAVKLEGGLAQVPKVKAMAREGIVPVAHVGLTPQTAAGNGGYRVVGKTQREAQEVWDAALALEDAGARLIVLECVPARLAAAISKRLSIPSIGIGSGGGTDGQVLVCSDVFGLTPSAPRFSKAYMDGAGLLKQATQWFVQDVKQRRFPDAAHIPIKGKQAVVDAVVAGDHGAASEPESPPEVPVPPPVGASARALPLSDVLGTRGSAATMAGSGRRQYHSSPSRTSAQPSVAVIGGGPIGSLLAAALSRGGMPTLLVTSSAPSTRHPTPATVHVSATDVQLCVGDVADGAVPASCTVVHPELALAQPCVMRGAETAVVAVHGAGTSAAADIAAAACANTVVTVQNGGGHKDLLAQLLPSATVVQAITTEGVRLVSKDSMTGQRVFARCLGDTVLEEGDGGAAADVQRLAAAWQRGGVDTNVVPSAHIVPLLWRKLMVNAAVNPMTALLRLRNGELLDAGHAAQERMCGLAEEVVATAAAAGVTGCLRDGETPFDVVQQVCTATADNVSSMLAAVLSCRRTEVRHVNGYVADTAWHLKVATPLNRWALHEVSLVEACGETGNHAAPAS